MLLLPMAVVFVSILAVEVSTANQFYLSVPYYVPLLGFVFGVITLISALLWPFALWISVPAYVSFMDFDVGRCGAGAGTFIPESWIVSLLLPGAAYGFGLTVVMASTLMKNAALGAVRISVLSLVVAAGICLPVLHSVDRHEDRLLGAGCSVLD